MKKSISILLIIVSLLISIYGYLYLPKEVIIQLSNKGEIANTMSKELALLLPFLIVLFGSIMYFIKNDIKYLLLELIGIAVPIITIIINILYK